MAVRWQSRTILATALVVLLVIACGVALLVQNRGRSAKNVGTTVDTVNVAQESPAAAWPEFYYQPFDMTMPYPTGMVVCVNGEEGYVIQRDACGSGVPLVAVRRNSAWDAMDDESAYNDAFAQELREAGMQSVSGKGTLLGGKPVSILLASFSDQGGGALLTYSLNSDPTTMKVSVAIRYDAPSTIAGFTAQDAVREILLRTKLKVAVKPGTPDPNVKDGWRTETVSAGSFSIAYPATANAYTAVPSATISRALEGGAQLEVRYGIRRETTLGSTEGYKKFTQKTITVNGAEVSEDRFVPVGNPGATSRILFVSFSRDSTIIGITFRSTGSELDESLFEKILSTFTFIDEPKQ